MTAPTEHVSRLGGRSPRRRGAILIVGTVIVGAIALAMWWALTRGPLAPTADPDEAPDFAAAYLSAWEAEDWSTMLAMAYEPPADFVPAHERWHGGLRVTETSFTADHPIESTSGISIPFTARLALSGLGEWSYEGRLVLFDSKGDWKVDWSHSTLHPTLNNAERLIAVREWPERADVLAVDGSPLMTNRPVIVVGVVPERVENLGQLTEALEEHLGIPPGDVVAQLEQPGVQPDWFLPVTQLRPEEYAELQPLIFPVPGTVFRPDMARLSPAAGFASHVLGRIGEATAELLEEYGDPYVRGDLVGRSGLERRFEHRLAGRPSGEVRRVDSSGTVLEVLHRFESEDPEPVQTTLALDVQAAADLALADVEDPAAVAVIEVSSGEIRALAARPYDGFNRALTGRYPPGSTFKVITAHGLLEQGVEPGDTVQCPAEVSVGGKVFGNAGGYGPGATTLAVAFAQSCNTTFAPLGSQLETLAELATTYGFNTNYELALPTAGGEFPAPADTAEQAAAAIGQAGVQTTPLHMASVIAAVGSGTWRSPRLVASDDPSIEQPLPAGRLDDLRELLGLVVTEGTGTGAAVEEEVVIGKTGTAEFLDPDPAKTHAWFVGLYDELGFAVLVEGGGSGGEVAAPIAARFVESLGDIRSGALSLFGRADCAVVLAGWPTFQGSGARQGCVARRSIAEPALRWSTQIGKLGWLNNPAVADRRVFVGSAGNLRFDADSADGVYALDLATGTSLWRFPAAEDVNGVAVGEGIVVASGDEGLVWALQAETGAVLWSHATDSGGPMLTNPLIVGDLVVVGDTEGVVYGLDVETGSLRWRAEVDGSVRGGAATDGEAIYVVGEAGDAHAFRTDGTELWSRKLTFVEHSGQILTARVLASPTVAGDLLVVPFVRDTSYEEPAMIALDRHTGIIRWRASDPNGVSDVWANLRSSPAVADGTLVFGQPLVGGLLAISTGSGEAAWMVNSGAPCDEHWSSAAVVGPLVLHGRSDGVLYGVNAQTKTVDWSYPMNTPPPEPGSGPCSEMASQPIHNSPAVADDGTVIIGSTAGELIAIGDLGW